MWTFVALNASIITLLYLNPESLTAVHQMNPIDVTYVRVGNKAILEIWPDAQIINMHKVLYNIQGEMMQMQLNAQLQKDYQEGIATYGDQYFNNNFNKYHIIKAKEAAIASINMNVDYSTVPDNTFCHVAKDLVENTRLIYPKGDQIVKLMSNRTGGFWEGQHNANRVVAKVRTINSEDYKGLYTAIPTLNTSIQQEKSGPVCHVVVRGLSGFWSHFYCEVGGAVVNPISVANSTSGYYPISAHCYPRAGFVGITLIGIGCEF